MMGLSDFNISWRRVIEADRNLSTAGSGALSVWTYSSKKPKHSLTTCTTRIGRIFHLQCTIRIHAKGYFQSSELISYPIHIPFPSLYCRISLQLLAGRQIWGKWQPCASPSQCHLGSDLVPERTSLLTRNTLLYLEEAKDNGYSGKGLKSKKECSWHVRTI